MFSVLGRPCGEVFWLGRSLLALALALSQQLLPLSTTDCTPRARPETSCKPRRFYQKLSGMTGTAKSAAAEFYEIYALRVVPIPTNKPPRRKDLPLRLYYTENVGQTSVHPASGLHASPLHTASLMRAGACVGGATPRGRKASAVAAQSMPMTACHLRCVSPPCCVAAHHPAPCRSTGPLHAAGQAGVHRVCC